jgi:hypothetical protein
MVDRKIAAARADLGIDNVYFNIKSERHSYTRHPRSAIVASFQSLSLQNATARMGAQRSPKPASTRTSTSSATAARTPFFPGTSSTAA